jgi:hypothetical protein
MSIGGVLSLLILAVVAAVVVANNGIHVPGYLVLTWLMEHPSSLLVFPVGWFPLRASSLKPPGLERVMAARVCLFAMNSYLLGHTFALLFRGIWNRSFQEVRVFFECLCGLVLVGYVITLPEVVSVAFACLVSAAVAWHLKSRSLFVGAALGTIMGARVSRPMQTEWPQVLIDYLSLYMKATIVAAVGGAVIGGLVFWLSSRFFQRRFRPHCECWIALIRSRHASV